MVRNKDVTKDKFPNETQKIRSESQSLHSFKSVLISGNVGEEAFLKTYLICRYFQDSWILVAKYNYWEIKDYFLNRHEGVYRTWSWLQIKAW